MNQKQSVPTITNPPKQKGVTAPSSQPPGTLGQPMPRSRVVTLLVLSFLLLLIALVSAYMMWGDLRHQDVPQPGVNTVGTAQQY
jgi:hypothetical protein